MDKTSHPVASAAVGAKTNFVVGSHACFAEDAHSTPLVRWPCFLGDSESNFLRTLLLASFFHKHAVISHLVWGTKHIILPICFGWCLDHRPTRGAIYRVSLSVNGQVPFISSNLGDQDGDPGGGKNGTYTYLLLHLSRFASSETGLP